MSIRMVGDDGWHFTEVWLEHLDLNDGIEVLWFILASIYWSEVTTKFPYSIVSSLLKKY